MNLSFSDFVKIPSNLNNSVCTFLLDTQAEVSVIKISSLHKKIPIDSSDYIYIKGVTDHLIRSLGSINVELYFPTQTLCQHLYVVPDNFNMPSDGILGKNFLKQYCCDISYSTSTLTIHTPVGPILTEIYEGPDNDTIIIPPRCEVIRKFNIQSFTTQSAFYAPAQMLAKDVFSSHTIVDPKNAFIRIINIGNETQVINKNKITTHSMDNYDVYKFDKTNDTRTKKVVDLLSKNVPDYIKSDFSKFCTEYPDIFALEEDSMTVNNFYTQRIRLKDDEPVYCKQYRLPFKHKEEINRQVQVFVDNGLVEPSISNYNSPVLIVPKKEKGAWRMCIDYRLVNKKVIADRFPLPRIDDILDSLGQAKFFSILDMFQGFHQIPLDEESKDITSFSTDKGSFRWKVLPFGLSIAPNSFTRMMSIAFSGLSPMQCFVYMDDLIVIGKSEKHHFKNLRSVFESCRKYNLKLNPYKCKFFRPEVTYIGHRCTQNGVLPDDSKIDTVKNYPTPTDKDSVKRFIAFANYYRKFIPHFASIAHPLNRLTRKTSLFKWSEECENSFNSLKQFLISPLILQYPDFSKQFIITVDASKYGTGAILSQLHGDNDLPISYASKTFTPGESNKPTIEQELIAIHYAIRHYRPYIYGTQFLIKSDHRPLIYLFSLKDPSSKLTRIRVELEEYDFHVEHIKGKDNVGADALSRIHITELKSLNADTKNVLILTRAMAKKLKTNTNDITTTDETNDIKNDINLNVYEELGTYHYNKTPRLKIMRNFIDENMKMMLVKNKKKLININITPNDFSELSLRKIFSMLEAQAEIQGFERIHIHNNDILFNYITAENFKVMGNEILNKLTILLTNPVMHIKDEKDKLAILNKFHDDPLHGGHCGQRRLYAKIRSKFYWKQMSKSIRQYVQKCHHCQVNKSYVKTKEELNITPTPQKQFDIVTVDTVGPLPKTESGNRYAVTLICNLTKYLVTAAVPDKDSRTIAKAVFDSFISIYGPMQQVLSDRGTEYKNQTLEELCRILQIELVHSTAYHHETLGTVERNHRTLNEYLRSYLDKNLSNWDEFLRKFTYCYNITPNSSLGLRYTPYELVFGKKPVILNIFKGNKIDPLYNIDNYAKELKYRLQIANSIASELVQLSKHRSKQIYDKKINTINLAIGDDVIITNEDRHKLENLFLGPYKVTRLLDKNIEIRNQINNKLSIVHKNRVRKYIKS